MEDVDVGQVSKRNSTANTSLQNEENPNQVLVTSLLGATLGTMCIFGIVGNIYTLVVTARSMRSTSSMCVYISNLALADLLYLCTIPFVVCTYFAKDWYFEEVGCRLLFSLDLLTMHASIFILTVMSVERYRAVASPLDPGRSRSCRKAVAALVWLLSCLLSLPMMITIHLRESPDPAGIPKRICYTSWKHDSYKVYLTILFNTSILAPGLIIGYLYARLGHVYWFSGRLSLERRNVNLKQKVLYMIFSIILAYWACFVPFWSWQLAKLYHRGLLGLSPAAHTYVNFFVTCLTYSNSCINPFLYTLLSKNYKESAARRRRGSAGRVTFRRGPRGGPGTQSSAAPRGVALEVREDGVP
ncbi:urotensin-2 receptor-like [Amblyraja radiata]|uniref:urotensin-2 receptor-like n=1 Tax=Amblyraja radiata TaxID=386614 RepID=UPI0014027F3E|nr:urotensin-2 receptor-like [Amblyraja radiata]